MLTAAKAISGVMVLTQYVLVFASVRSILKMGDSATGEDVADGPLTQLFLQVWFLAIIFFIDIFEEIPMHRQDRGGKRCLLTNRNK